MFKLLALRPLKGCASHIRKCLKEDVFYYLCDDYRIDWHKGVIRRRSPNLKPLPEDFFLKKPKVNISAIVGKNGDGKSTIVELIIRLVNNCAITNDLAAKKNSLMWVKEVRAELYYMVDNIVYMLQEKEEKEGALVYEIANLQKQDKDEWPIQPNKIDVKHDRDSFFFTLVSNYSHYAYNMKDYKKEWDETGYEEDEDEKCWLHYIFHKNDGYMAPITLHPYRYIGDLRINQEKDLSKQRLLSIFVNADNPEINGLSLRRVNGKDADVLVLKEVESKLQNKTILEFFKKTKNRDRFRLVEMQFAKAYKELSKGKDDEYNRLVNDYLTTYYEELLDEVLARGEDFKKFVVKVIEWLNSDYEKYEEAFSSYSDIEIVLDNLENFKERFPEQYPKLKVKLPIEEYKEKYDAIKRLNSTQLARLDTIYRILLLWGYDPDIVTKKYSEMTHLEKCQQYKVYKTWSILTTYPQYETEVNSEDLRDRIIESSPKLEECFRYMNDDRHSHITRKILQVDNYVKEGFEGGDLYERLGEKDENTGIVKVSLSKLKEHYGGQYVNLDHLPPAIYKWDVLFKKVGNAVADIEFDSFSSGEKQMLNSTGAIIYHLQNLTDTAITHYRNVNIILEEIELYYHADYQRKLIKQLLNQIERANIPNIDQINILFVTHSPFILSDIPKNQVLFLEDGLPQNTMQENTFGANIHSLLKNGFFLPNLPMGEFAYEKINELFRKLNEGDVGKDEYAELYQQIMLVGEPYLRSQLLKMYRDVKGLVD